MSERFVPPQEELEAEIRARADADPPFKCPRCGTPGQRFLRRCSECGRRYRSLFGRPRSGTDFPANWAYRDS